MVVLFFMFSGCSELRKLERSLPPGDKQFISLVRYIISKEEKVMFLNISPQEREDFKEGFWKKRDPDPLTEENEYRDTYLARIEKANKLFTSEGRQGFLSDRGRIFVLLGEPDQRQVYPMGYSQYDPPVEIWYYGMFPLMFIDHYRLGKYEIDPVSSRYVSELTKARMFFNPEVAKLKNLFDVGLKVKTISSGKIDLQIDVPYKLVNFEEKGKVFKGTLDISVVITDSAGSIRHQSEKSHSLSLTQQDLKNIKSRFIISYPIEINPGKYTLKVIIKDRFSDKKSDKTLSIRVK